MAAYQIIGGVVSPSGIVIAPDEESAKTIYNQWLKLSAGYTDDGVGVYQLQDDTFTLIDGSMITYDKNVRGFVPPRFRRMDVKSS